MEIPPVHHFPLVAFVALLAAAAWTDFRWRRIPNVLVASLATAGLTHAVLVGGLRGGAASLLGLGVGFLILLWPFARGLMGAGDVKLLAAIGAWSGAGSVIQVALLGALIGGVLSLVALLWLDQGERARVRGNVTSAFLSGNLSVPEPSVISRRGGIPFGIALAVAGWMVVAMGVSL
jgi:prepilin peptidase CpaA